MQMPFGKHRGEEIDDIPEDYLFWCLRNLENLTPWLRENMEVSLEHRRSRKMPEPPQQTCRTDRGAVLSLVNMVHKEMTFRFHPDRGGSNEAMKAVQAYVERLRSLVQEL